MRLFGLKAQMDENIFLKYGKISETDEGKMARIH